MTIKFLLMLFHNAGYGEEEAERREKKEEKH